MVHQMTDVVTALLLIHNDHFGRIATSLGRELTWQFPDPRSIAPAFHSAAESPTQLLQRVVRQYDTLALFQDGVRFIG